jgi:hypothetical protein
LVESARGIFLEGLRESEMNLRDVVNKYLAIAGGYGRIAALADFGLDPAQTERFFSPLDEDYHISRFFHFTKGSGAAYKINGFEHTHVSIDAEIETIF